MKYKIKIEIWPVERLIKFKQTSHDTLYII